jgi:hypothetical protein
MNFEIIGEVTEVENIAVSGSIRILPYCVDDLAVRAGGSAKVLLQSAWRMGRFVKRRFTGLKPMA